jgi:hypothetical protein
MHVSGQHNSTVYNTTTELNVLRLYSTSSQFTRANAGLQQPVERRLWHSYRVSQLFGPGAPTDHWPTKVLLAELIVRWGASPLQYIPRELASRTANDRRLRPYMSNLSLPSQPTKRECLSRYLLFPGMCLLIITGSKLPGYNLVPKVPCTARISQLHRTWDAGLLYPPPRCDPSQPIYITRFFAKP